MARRTGAHPWVRTRLRAGLRAVRTVGRGACVADASFGPQCAGRRQRVAGLTNWSIAFVLLLPAFAIPVLAAVRGGTVDRLVALPLAGAVAALLLALVTFVFDQAPSSTSRSALLC